jgi:hypothetical protein
MFHNNSDVFVITFGEKENDEVNKDIDTFLGTASYSGYTLRIKRLHS